MAEYSDLVKRFAFASNRLWMATKERFPIGRRCLYEATGQYVRVSAYTDSPDWIAVHDGRGHHEPIKVTRLAPAGEGPAIGDPK